jgi:hypothetical protein
MSNNNIEVLENKKPAVHLKETANTLFTETFEKLSLKTKSKEITICSLKMTLLNDQNQNQVQRNIIFIL